jgi:hypothetical protein
MDTMLQPVSKDAADIKLAAEAKIAGLSDHDAFMHVQQLADAMTTRPLTAQEELEALKCIFGSDAEFLD